MKPYRIACLFPGIYRGGSEQVLFNLTRGFQALGHSVTYFSLKPIDPQHIVLDSDLPKPYLPHPSKLLNFNFKWLRHQKLNQKIQEIEAKEGAFDLILSNINTRAPFKTLHPDRVFYFLHIDPYAGTAFRYPEHSKAFQKESARLRACYHNKHVIAVSQGAAKALLEKIKAQPKSMHVIYNPFDAHKIQEQASASPLDPPTIPNTPYLLHVGRFDPQKRHDLLFSAYQKLKNPPKLVLLTHVTETLTQMIARFGLQDQVILPGMQANPFVWMKHAKALILCSDWEGFGNVIVEALMCGTPVISTDCPSGPSEILTGHLSSGLVPMNHPDALAEKIQEILQHPYTVLDQDTQRFEMTTILPHYLGLIS